MMLSSWFLVLLNVTGNFIITILFDTLISILVVRLL